MRVRTVLMAGVVLAVPVVAGGQPAGGPAASVATDPTATWDLAGAPAGPRALLVWERGTGGELRHSTRSRSAWSAPARLGSAPGRTTRGTLSAAVNARGEAVVAWRRSTGTGERLLVATRSPAGRWSPLREVARAGRLGAVHLALAADGTAVVAWGQVRDLRTATPVRAAVRLPGRAFGPVLRAGTSDPSSSPLDLQVRAVPGGRAVVAWVDPGTRTAEVVAFRGGRWRAPATLPVAPDGTRVRLSPAGDAFALWVVRRPRTPGSLDSVVGRLRASVAPAGRAWRPPVNVSGRDAPIGADDTFLLGPGLEVDGRGRAFAAWIRFARPVPEGRDGVRGSRGRVFAALGDRRGWRPGVPRSRAGADAADVGLTTGPGPGALLHWEEARADADDRPVSSRRTRGTSVAWDAVRRVPGARGTGLVIAALGADGTAAFAADAPALRRPGPASPWRPVEVQEAGAFGSVVPERLFVAGDGAAWAVLERFPSAAYEPGWRSLALVPLRP